MTMEQRCARCHDRVATLLGVPADAALTRNPDGSPLAPNEFVFSYEPATWIPMCQPCLTKAMTAGEFVAAYDIAGDHSPPPRSS